MYSRIAVERVDLLLIKLLGVPSKCHKALADYHLFTSQFGSTLYWGRVLRSAEAVLIVGWQ